MDCIREFSFIDILVGFTCDKKENSELFFRTKYILDRRVESVDKYFYRDIPSLIDLTEKCIIKRDPRLLIDEGDHSISLVMFALFEVLLHFLIASEGAIEDEVQIMMEAKLEYLICDTY